MRRPPGCSASLCPTSCGGLGGTMGQPRRRLSSSAQDWPAIAASAPVTRTLAPRIGVVPASVAPVLAARCFLRFLGSSDRLRGIGWCGSRCIERRCGILSLSGSLSRDVAARPNISGGMTSGLNHKSKHAAREWQLKVRYCRERGAYLRIIDRVSLGVGD